MENKPYRFGLLLGRFQILHKGHGAMIQKALELCDEVGIFIGSSQEDHTRKNPFTYEERKSFLLKAFPDLHILPLEDQGIGNVLAWGDYVYEMAKKGFGKSPDIFITGKEARRTSWFRDEIPMAELAVPKTIATSSSEVKEYLLSNEREEFEKRIHEALKSDFEFMRERIVSCKEMKDTKSI